MITLKSYQRITETAKKIGEDTSKADFLDRGAAHHEGGMMEILERMAKQFYLNDDSIRSSKETIQKSYEAETIYNRLEENIPNEYKKLLSDLEESYSELGVLQQEDGFIHGFVACYRFFNKNGGNR